MNGLLTRREWMRFGAGALSAAGLSATSFARQESISAARLPRWRGFNLLEKFTLAANRPYLESDFDLIANWKFDFVRLPTDYRCWTVAPGDYRENVLRDIDQAVAWGRARNIHVNLCLHRAPGYCVNPPPEALNLWADGDEGEEARRQFAAQWAMFAARYKDVPSTQLSFDLVNEPSGVSAANYARAVTSAVTAIRALDPARLIVADGLRYGNDPVLELVPLKIAQSTRGYAPMQVSHYGASWVQASAQWPLPSWPLRGGEAMNKQVIWDRSRLQREQIAPWIALQQEHGVGVHVGEWGAFNRTPHAVALAWMLDQLTLWREANWGWALWNLRGPFGVLDSERADVNYEKFKNHQLDRQMLELLRHG